MKKRELAIAAAICAGVAALLGAMLWAAVEALSALQAMGGTQH